MLIKRMVIIAVAVLLYSSFAHANLSVGVRLGPGLANVEDQAEGEDDPFFKMGLLTGDRVGIYANAFMEIPVQDWFSIVPGIGFSNRGYVVKPRNPMTYDYANITFENDYLTFPIHFKVQPSMWAFRPFLQVGPELGILLTTETKSFSGVSLELANKFNSFDMGLDFCLGAEMSFGKVTPQVYAQYYYGLTNAAKDSGDLTLQNLNVSFMLGVKYEL